MIQTFGQTLLQLLGVLDGLSVALILGSITILTISEITRKAHQELDRGTVIACKVLAVGIVAQIVYRIVDTISAFNLVTSGQIAVSDIPPLYIITLLMVLVAFVTYILFRFHKIQTALFIFLETALWYTMFLLTQFLAQSGLLTNISAAALTLLTIILVILIVLLADSAKRYYHKRSK